MKAWLLLAWWTWIVVWACWVSMLAWGSLWRRIVCLTRRGAARLLDARLRRESSGGDGGGGVRVSEGVRRSLYSGEGVSVALSVVARGGSSVVLDDGDVRRVLRGRPVASSWDVDSVLGSFESSFGRGAGGWMAGAGEVANPPSGWDDELTPFVGDDDG